MLTLNNKNVILSHSWHESLDRVCHGVILLFLQGAAHCRVLEWSLPLVSIIITIITFKSNAGNEFPSELHTAYSRIGVFVHQSCSPTYTVQVSSPIFTQYCYGYTNQARWDSVRERKRGSPSQQPVWSAALVVLYEKKLTSIRIQTDGNKNKK